MISISKLKPGDRFSEVPAASHGPSVVLESYRSGHLWCIKYSNPNIVNPPGVLYTYPRAKVRRLQPKVKP